LQEKGLKVNIIQFIPKTMKKPCVQVLDVLPSLSKKSEFKKLNL